MTRSDEHWLIEAWSTERGRGSIRNKSGTVLQFDASIADAPNFQVGETVNVLLDPPAHVLRVSPLRTRKLRNCFLKVDSPTQLRTVALLEQLSVAMDYRIAHFSEEILVIQGDNDHFSYGHLHEIQFMEPAYLEIPARFSAIRIDGPTAQQLQFLETRVTLEEELAAIRFVDDEEHCYFVVAESISIIQNHPTG